MNSGDHCALGNLQFSRLCRLPQICVSAQSCFWTLQAVCWQFDLYFLLWYACSTARLHTDSCVSLQIMSNQLNHISTELLDRYYNHIYNLIKNIITSTWLNFNLILNTNVFHYMKTFWLSHQHISHLNCIV